MPKQNVFLQSFNVGVVDRKKLVRTDLERLRLAAELQTNLLCTTSGNMFFRPGFEYLSTTLDDGRARLIEFVYSADDAHLLVLTDSFMRVYVNDELVTRPAVSTRVNRGDFAATGTWDLDATDGATAEISADALSLTAAAKGSSASASQEVSVSSDDRGIEHALNIVIKKGPVTFRCGSTSQGDQYISETQLGTGHHSLAFVPTGSSFFLYFRSADDTTSQSASDRVKRVVTNCQVEAAGIMSLQTPWGLGSIGKLSRAQSADVMFTATGTEQYKIERRSPRSWSVVKYVSNLGPFTADRTAPVRLRPDATEGNTTLSASGPFFAQQHVGSLFRLFHDGSIVNQTLAGGYVFTDPIKVTGISGSHSSYNDRDWTYTVTGTWTGTMKVFRSYDSETYGFKAYRNHSETDTVGFTGNVTDVGEQDGDDNSIIYYRLGFDNGYTSGAAEVEITYDGGGGYGICRVTAFNSKTNVDIEVIKPFHNTTFTSDWKEGEWSDTQSWPTGVCLSEGRLFQSGNDKLWASVSDAYDDFDESTEGDSGPISRSIAIGGVNQVNWLLPLQRVVIGANGGEISIKSSGLDEPLTPTALTLKSSSTVGSAAIAAVHMDGRGIFVDRTTRALFEIVFDAGGGDYATAELTRLCSTWFRSGVVDLAISRRPDTRVWAVLADGTCMVMVYEPEQQVVAFVPIVTDGIFEHVAVLPGTEQDDVYFVVQRTINNEVKRHIEKMALDSEAVPGTIAKVMDSFVSGVNSPASAMISGLTHLKGKMVKVWADGAPLTEVVDGLRVPKLFLVSGSGSITLPAAVSNYCAGLPYSGAWKSSRLAYGAAGGTAMLAKQKVSTIGLIMSDYVRSGIRYGQYLDNPWKLLMPLPVIANGDVADEVTSGDIVTDEGSITFDGAWTIDSRVCMSVDWPANFLGLVFEVSTNA